MNIAQTLPSLHSCLEQNIGLIAERHTSVKKVSDYLHFNKYAHGEYQIERNKQFISMICELLVIDNLSTYSPKATEQQKKDWDI